MSVKEHKLPNTGISGLYEVMLGTDDAAYAMKYFGDFGFKVVEKASFSKKESLQLYGVPSKLTSYRLQNGNIDTHGLLRILEWEKPLGNGVGYAPIESIGSRIAVMRTTDIFRLYDIYQTAREQGKKQWLPTTPVADDLFGLNTGDRDFFNRPIIVRENAVYGEFFNHIFFQRYGYMIPGYGTIEADTALNTSEFTHHDFVIKANSMKQMSYLSTALGLQAEDEPAMDGDWMKGPKQVFQMEAGFSHEYQGFVSPNNICGKLKFFIPKGIRPDFSEKQRIGEKGITLHSFYSTKIEMLHKNVQNHNLTTTEIIYNEFGERSFVFSDSAGVSWQIIERTSAPKHNPARTLEFVKE